MPFWLAFERRIFVKQNAADVLRKVLRHGSERHLALLHGETIVIGTATDPFQPAERRFRITRSILEVLAEHPGLSVCIITKSPLVTRDIDVLKRINRHSELSIHLSLISLDRELARRIEPRAPTPEARLRALARLRDERDRNGHQRDAGAAGDHRWSGCARVAGEGGRRAWRVVLNACSLRLRATARARYLPFIEQEFPHLAKRYWATYGRERQDERRRTASGSRRGCADLCDRYGRSLRPSRPERRSRRRRPARSWPERFRRRPSQLDLAALSQHL